MLALRFSSVVVGDLYAGYFIRKYGVDPHLFSQPVGFFRGASLCGVQLCRPRDLHRDLCSLSLASGLAPKRACSCIA